jgi:hypothetical protein
MMLLNALEFFKKPICFHFSELSIYQPRKQFPLIQHVVSNLQIIIFTCQVIESQSMIYIVSEFASQGEIFGKNNSK